MKIYLSIFAFAILQSNFLALEIKSNSLKKHNGEELVVNNEKECKNIDQNIKDLAEVVAKNEPEEKDNPPSLTGNIDPKQKQDHKWTIIGPKKNGKCLKFHDVGVNSEGHIVAIGANGKLYEYLYDLDEFKYVQGNFDLHNLRRVDIGYDGIIYVVSISGDTYYLSCSGHWIKLPGCAIDIGTGRGDEVAKIGCDDYCEGLDDKDNCPSKPNDIVDKKSPHIYRLICHCKCKCCRHRCNIFIKHHFKCHKDNDRKCYWIKYPEGPVYKKNNKYYPCEFSRIDVNANGYPMVIAHCGNKTKIYQMIGNEKNVFLEVREFNNDKKITDLCGDNYGNIFYIKDHHVYLYNQDSNYDVLIGGADHDAGLNISCGPYAQPTVTDKKCCLKTTTKVGYN
jgi:hypothetical protein